MKHSLSVQGVTKIASREFWLRSPIAFSPRERCVNLPMRIVERSYISNGKIKLMIAKKIKIKTKQFLGTPWPLKITLTVHHLWPYVGYDSWPLSPFCSSKHMLKGLNFENLMNVPLYKLERDWNQKQTSQIPRNKTTFPCIFTHQATVWDNLP